MPKPRRSKIKAVCTLVISNRTKKTCPSSQRIGERYCHDDYGWLTITAVSGKTKSGAAIFRVVFDDTGKMDLTLSHIRKGSFKRYDRPTVYGVGYTFPGARTKYPKKYRVWHAMLTRCYDERTWVTYPSYRDCYVCPRWLHFINFLEDWNLIPGSELWGEGKTPQLDKDVRILGNKLYSLETCMFCSQIDNTRAARNKKVRHLVSGKIYKSLVEAAVATSCSSSTISEHCNGNRACPRWEFVT